MNRQPVSMPKYAALYERLSRDDEHQGPSHSILNQQTLLEELAEKYGYKEFRHFTDDGISGTRFDRPGFLQMMDEIETGNISAVLTKDASRIGRDHLRVGLFLETLREKDVRFIAHGDNVDTDLGEDDYLPFRNIMHEYSVRDTSRKIKTAFQVRGKSGKRMTHSAAYGYIKSPVDNYTWLIDEEAAAVIRRIFQMSIDGKGTWQIARILTDENILRPSAYIAKREGNRFPAKGPADSCKWSGTTIINILRRQEYMGHTVNFRTYAKSYKDKNRIRKPKEEWLVFENTHEPIVDAETWETAQKCQTVKRRPNNYGEPNPLTGLVYCPDCNKRMYNHRKENSDKYPSQDMYQCQSYNKYPKECKTHYIQTRIIQFLTLSAIKAVSGYVKEHEEEFLQLVKETRNQQNEETAKVQKKQLVKFQKRCTELDLLIKQIYEDKVKGSLSEKRFEILSGEYETEQANLEMQISELQEQVDKFTTESTNTDSFIKLVKKYTEITELTPAILNEFIDRIYVHHAKFVNDEREQEVEIHFNFIGKVDVPVEIEELSPDEQEKFERKERRRLQQRAYWKKWSAVNRPKKSKQKLA